MINKVTLTPSTVWPNPQRRKWWRVGEDSGRSSDSCEAASLGWGTGVAGGAGSVVWWGPCLFFSSTHRSPLCSKVRS